MVSLGCTLVRILNGLCLRLMNRCGLRHASSEDPHVQPCMMLHPTNPTYSCIVGACLLLLLWGKMMLTLEKRETGLMSVAGPLLVYFIWVHVLKSLDNDCIDLFCIGAIWLWVVQILS